MSSLLLFPWRQISVTIFMLLHSLLRLEADWDLLVGHVIYTKISLEVGPHRPYLYLGIDTSPLWASIKCIVKFWNEIVLHHLPAHVGITGNEIADE